MKINIACGYKVLDDYVNVDLFVKGPNIINMDVAKLDYPDMIFNEVLAEDIIEHFPRLQWQTVLREWLRVLSPGGVIKLQFPDMRLLSEALLQTKSIEEWNVINRRIFGSQGDGSGASGMYHYTGFCYEYLREYLEKEYEMEYVSHHLRNYNCFLVMKKRKPSAIDCIKIIIDADKANFREEILKRNQSDGFWEQRSKIESALEAVGVDLDLQKRHINYLKPKIVGKKVFEIACGYGRYLELIKNDIDSYAACETSDNFRSKIDISYRNNVSPKSVDIVDFAPNKYDVIFEVISLSSIFDKITEEFIEKLRISLTDTGKILFLEPKHILEINKDGSCQLINI